VHTPEGGGEFDFDQMKRKADEAKFTFPIVTDNEKSNWNAWGNSMWPSVYLVDKKGYIRHWWYGELAWQGQDGEQQMRRRIEELLAESE
jgi:hypothetical protein